MFAGPTSPAASSRSASRRFLETGKPADALVGNGPLIINKRTGEVREGWSGRPWEEQLDES